MAKRRRLSFKKFVFSAALAAVLLLVGFSFLRHSPIPGPLVLIASSTKAATSAVTAQKPAPAAPNPQSQLQLIVPKLKQSIPLAMVGLTKSGDMAVPHDTAYAGLYKLGPKPGQIGSAVIDGHNQILGKGNGVFWNINKLAAGDDIYVQEGLQPRKHFVVSDTKVYDLAGAPVTQIFGATDKARLNLITCAGKWDKSQNEYTQRLVVYASLVI